MKQLLLFCLSLSFFNAVAQQHDNLWLFGYKYGGTVRRMTIDFSKDSLAFDYQPGAVSMIKSGAWVCDSSGALQLVTSGCYIGGATEDTIGNGAGLNPGFQADIFCGYGDLNAHQYGFFLPAPSNNGRYYLVHYNPQQRVQDLMYTLVDMADDDGHPAIIEKNKSIVQDTVSIGGVAAVKHGNGRDWWIVCTVDQSNEYYILLLDPAGVALKQHLNIGEPTTHRLFSEMNFSPDGTKLAYSNAKDDLRLFDFDRCTGTLSNPQFYPLQDTADITDWLQYGGMAFSADSRYLYRTSEYQIYQYDLLAPDIGASRQVVAEFDGFVDAVGFAYTTFGFMELAPDGRIFCKPPSGGAYNLHVIWHPERAGAACDVRQHCLEPPYPVANIPTFPTYRQGAVDGAACDTLGLDSRPLAGWRYDRTGGLAVDFTSVAWYEPNTWIWNFGDPASGANQSAQQNPVHVFSHAGTFEVCQTVINLYGSDKKCKPVTVGLTGLQDAPAAGSILMYPNPAAALVSLSGLDGRTVDVHVYDLMGRLVKSGKAVSTGFTVGDLPEGLYRVRLFDANRLILDQNLLRVQP